jgi:hypothetical protein
MNKTENSAFIFLSLSKCVQPYYKKYYKLKIFIFVIAIILETRHKRNVLLELFSILKF